MKKIIIIGAGIVGLSLAREFLRRGHKKVLLIEKEKEIAKHQSSRNSGVMHAGLYYKPGSLKSKLCRDGINLMKSYCDKNSIKWEECGKIVIAKNALEENRLNELFERGIKNNLKGIQKIKSKQISNFEPYVKANNAIYVPEESIVNYKEVAKSYLKEIIASGGSIKYFSKVKKIKNVKNKKVIYLDNDEVLDADVLISSSGIFSDKLTEMMGIGIDNQKILPFRGEYYLLKDEFKYLVKGLIYPVPDPSFPFLGVHFTKMIDGRVEAGPNAVLALAREGYNWRTINMKELIESISYVGLRKFILRYPFITLGEISRSFSKTLFVESLRKLIPDVNERMFYRGSSGIRAQLMNKKGDLIQDFDIKIKGNLISILNAPSPAATSSLAIAKYVAEYLNF
tara:strand:+ start:16135 stop:17325 length:1191 start_codon:yes stop_codon:yes gene_type:complete